MDTKEYAAFASVKFREEVAPRLFEIISKLKMNHAQVRAAMESEKNPVLRSYGLDHHWSIPLQFIRCCFRVSCIQPTLSAISISFVIGFRRLHVHSRCCRRNSLPGSSSHRQG